MAVTELFIELEKSVEEVNAKKAIMDGTEITFRNATADYEKSVEAARVLQNRLQGLLSELLPELGGSNVRVR